MSVSGLPKVTISVPFVGGLDTKSDPRALQPPGLLIAKDIAFDEIGGIQTRKPVSASGTPAYTSSIYPSGTISNVRRAYAYGDELVLFTKDSLYTWNANLSKWVLRGTHLAVKTTETPVFIKTTDQIDCDRTELSGTVFYTWTDSNGINLAAVDKTTGSVVLAPSPISSCSRGRLVALPGDTRVLWFFKNVTGGLTCAAYNPDTPQAGAVAETEILAAANFNDHYDVVADTTGLFAYLACRRDTTTSYSVFQIAADTAIENQADPARTCDGPIAIAMAPNGTHLTVIRADGTNIEGDYLTTALADVTVNQAVGTFVSPANQVTAAYRSVTDGGQYRCYAFWSAAEAVDGTAFNCKYNYVDTGGTIGTQGTFLSDLGVASRAFDHEGRVFVHLAFGGSSQTGVAGLRAQLQNTYFLYRDDAFLVAKECTAIAGGLAPTTGRLPSVQSLGSGAFAWCGTERRVIPLGVSHLGYSDRGPRDITITFDSNEARRVARLGGTLYIAGGEILQYDGQQLVELGFHTYPWRFTANPGAAGNVENGSYTFKETWRWDNAKGERDRSTTATQNQTTVSSGPDILTIGVNPPLRTSHKSGMAVEIWRTAKNPDLDSPFYLVTGQDPAVTTGSNCFIPMPAFTSGAVIANFDDDLADASLTTKEANPENNGVLENLAPPPGYIIAATDERLFLAGIAGDPHRVWYSKLRGTGEVASFHEALTIDVPSAGGDITALALMVGTLVVFRESAIYIMPGEGFDNLGGGVNYGPARTVSQDVGAVSAESVALTPMGLVFKSSKGWYLLSQGFGLEYIGGKVSDYDSETVHAVHTVETSHSIRVVTSGRVLAFDYLVNEWSEWTISDAIHALVYNGIWHDVHTTGVRAEQTDYALNADGLDVETAWIKPADLQGAARIWRVLVLGEYRSAFHLRVRIAYDYAAPDTYTDDVFWTPDTTTVGGPLQVRIGPSRQQCQAIKIRLTAVSASNHSNPPAGEALKLTGLGFEVAIRPGLHRRIPNAQRT